MFRLVCILLLVLLGYQLVVQAPNSPNILSREDTPNCVDGCSKRTMFSIVWGCVSTTIICAWAAIHPNIPPREGPVKRTIRRLELMLWTMIAPEVLPCWALNQQLAARTIIDLYNKRKGYEEEKFWNWKTVKGWFSFYEITAASNPAWSLKHGHFLIMGGIHLVEPQGNSTLSNAASGYGTQQTPSITSIGEPEGVPQPKADTEIGRAPAGNKASAQEGRVTVLTLEMLKELLDLSDDDFEIHVTEDEIKDRSKGDMLSKIIFILQSSWFILQCIGRCVQGLNLTQLELTTLAMASLNAITIVLWWDKPLGVQTPVRVYLKRQLTDAERKVDREQEGKPAGRSNLLCSLTAVADRFREELHHRTKTEILLVWVPLLLLSLVPSLFVVFALLFFNSAEDLLWPRSFPVNATRVPTFYVPRHQHSDAFWHLSLYLILGPFFGSIHCAGWNFDFPSVIQQHLWRVAALCVTTLPIIISSLIFKALCQFKGLAVTYRTFYDIKGKVLEYKILLFSTLYVAARVVLLGLAIALLRHQPPGSFIAVDWTKFYPHIL